MRNSIHLGAVAAALLAALASLPALAQRYLEVAPDVEEACCARKLATLVETDNGRHLIGASQISSAFLKGPQPGDRLGGQLLIDLAAFDGIDGEAIWGTGNVGRVADLMISAAIKPGSLLALTSSGYIIELRGIWGTGNVGMPDPLRGVVAHGPFWDVAACGAATSMAEGYNQYVDPLLGYVDPLLGYVDPLLGFDNPIIAIGTSGGCVGFVQVPDPNEWQTSPLEATGGPLIQVAAGLPVTELALVPMHADWVINHEEQFPGSEWVPPTADWFPASEWIPDPNHWIPEPDQWYEFAALAGGQLHGVYPGARASERQPGQPPNASFKLDVAGARIAASDFGAQRDGFAAADQPLSLLLTDGSPELTRASLGPGLVRGGSVPLDVTGAVAMHMEPVILEVNRIEVGSLWAITDDGQSLVFAPDFDPNTGALGELYRVGGVQSVDLDPDAFNRDAKGRWVTARIEAAGGEAGGIDPASMRLHAGGEPLAPQRHALEDSDGDGHVELMLKFDRKALAARLANAEPGDNVPVTLSWDFAEVCDDAGTPCRGSTLTSLRIVQ